MTKVSNPICPVTDDDDDESYAMLPLSQKQAQPGCKRTPPLPSGFQLKDVLNRTWTLGKSVGSGAFGDVYLIGRNTEAVGDKAEPVGDNADLVVKVEPHDNGPLFVEMHFFMNAAMPSQMAAWEPKNGGKKGFVGMPANHASGSFMYNGEKYRFLIMDRLGQNIDKFFQSGLNVFPLGTVLKLGVQVTDILEYIHSRNYVHNDIKADNLLLGWAKEDNGLVYLVDFGLACKYKDSLGFHHDGYPDDRKAHEGTMEYLSREAHSGVHSRRGDFETLGYNMVHWLSGHVPWSNILDKPDHVAMQKSFYMGNIKSFLTRCFGPDPYPKVLEKYLNYVAGMDFETTPDYDRIRNMMSSALRKEGEMLTGDLVFLVPNSKGKLRHRNKSESSSEGSLMSDDVPELLGMEKSARMTRQQSKSISDTSSEGSNGSRDSSGLGVVSIRTRRQKSKSTSETSSEGNPASDITGHRIVKAAAIRTRRQSKCTSETSSEGSPASDIPGLCMVKPTIRTRRQKSKSTSETSSEGSHCSDTPIHGRVKSNNVKTRRQSEECPPKPKTWNWEDILCNNPEALVRSNSRSIDLDTTARQAAFQQQQKQSLSNPTPEMTRLLRARLHREITRHGGLSWKEKDLTPSPLTPAMEDVIAKRSKRLAVEGAPITPEPSDASEGEDEVDLFAVNLRKSLSLPNMLNRGKGPGRKYKSNLSNCSPLERSGSTSPISRSSSSCTPLERSGSTSPISRSSSSCTPLERSGSTSPISRSSSSSPDLFIPAIRKDTCKICEKEIYKTSMDRHLHQVHKLSMKTCKKINRLKTLHIDLAANKVKTEPSGDKPFQLTQEALKGTNLDFKFPLIVDSLTGDVYIAKHFADARKSRKYNTCKQTNKPALVRSKSDNSQVRRSMRYPAKEYHPRLNRRRERNSSGTKMVTILNRVSVIGETETMDLKYPKDSPRPSLSTRVPVNSVPIIFDTPPSSVSRSSPPPSISDTPSPSFVGTESPLLGISTPTTSNKTAMEVWRVVDKLKGIEGISFDSTESSSSDDEVFFKPIDSSDEVSFKPTTYTQPRKKPTPPTYPANTRDKSDAQIEHEVRMDMFLNQDSDSHLNILNLRPFTRLSTRRYGVVGHYDGSNNSDGAATSATSSCSKDTDLSEYTLAPRRSSPRLREDIESSSDGDENNASTNTVKSDIKLNKWRVRGAENVHKKLYNPDKHIMKELPKRFPTRNTDKQLIKENPEVLSEVKSKSTDVAATNDVHCDLPMKQSSEQRKSQRRSPDTLSPQPTTKRKLYESTENNSQVNPPPLKKSKTSEEVHEIKPRRKANNSKVVTVDDCEENPIDLQNEKPKQIEPEVKSAMEKVGVQSESISRNFLAYQSFQEAYTWLRDLIKTNYSGTGDNE